EAIIKQSIRITEGGKFSFWSCNSFDLANNLAQELLCSITSGLGWYKAGKSGSTMTRWPNRSDIVVVGSKGACVPLLTKAGSGKVEIGTIAVDDGLCNGQVCKVPTA